MRASRAVGPVGPLRMLSPSDCQPAGPAGPYVAGGPVGPDGTFEHSVLDHADPADQHAVIQEVLEPLEHAVLDHADPAGQHAVILLAQMARLQVAPLVHVGRCLHFFTKYWSR